MGNAVFISRIIGPMYVIIAVGMLLNLPFYRRVMEDYGKNAVQIFWGGLMALLIGLLILLSHNVWRADWTVLVTIVGWGGIIKGIWLMVFPESVSGFMRVYQKNKGMLAVHALIALAMGVCFTYFGYFAR